MRLWRIALLILVGIGGAFGGYAAYARVAVSENSPIQSGPQLVTVQRGNIASTVSATGSVAMPLQAKLSFEAAGALIELNVKEGDHVKKGQALARLDTADLERNVRTAELKLRSAEIGLEKAQEPYSQVDVIKSQSAVSSAEASLQSAQAALDKAKAPPDASSIAAAEAAVRDATTALEISRRQREIVRNSDTVNRAVYDRQNEYNFHEVRYGEQLKLYEAGQLDKNALDAYYGNLISAKGKLESAKQDAANAMVKADADVAKAEESLRKATESLDNLGKGPDPNDIVTKEAQVRSAEASLVKAREDLKTVLRGADPYDLELRRNDVESAKAGLAQAKDQVARATLTAPWDGVVASVGASVGDRVTASTVVVQLVNPDTLQVKASIDEIDVAQVKTGQEVTITLDAVPDARLSGKVTVLSPLANRQSGVVSYPITIDLEKSAGTDVREGMTAAASIVTASRQNVLVAPARAVQTRGSVRTVQVMVDGKPVDRNVQVGLSDGQSTEILQGLQEGDQVAIPTSTRTGQTSQQGPQVMPGMGLGGAVFPSGGVQGIRR